MELASLFHCRLPLDLDFLWEQKTTFPLFILGRYIKPKRKLLKLCVPPFLQYLTTREASKGTKSVSLPVHGNGTEVEDGGGAAKHVGCQPDLREDFLLYSGSLREIDVV